MRRLGLAAAVLLAAAAPAAANEPVTPVQAAALFRDMRTDAGRLITFCRFRAFEQRAALVASGRASGNPRVLFERTRALAASLGPDFEQAWLIGARSQSVAGTEPGDSYWRERGRLVRTCERPQRPRR